MNIAFFTRPKQEITYLYSDFTVRQALEKMHSSSYMAVPVLDREGHYIATISEGDLLWFIVKGEGGEPHTMAIESLEQFKLTDVGLNTHKNQPVSISTSPLLDATRYAQFGRVIRLRSGVSCAFTFISWGCFVPKATFSSSVMVPQCST